MDVIEIKVLPFRLEATAAHFLLSVATRMVEGVAMR